MDNFLDNIVKIAVEIDTSMSDLESLLEQEYDTVTWRQSANPCQKCKDLNNQTWDLKDFIEEIEYNAPLFSHSHPNCICSIRISGDNLEDVEVDFNGIR